MARAPGRNSTFHVAVVVDKDAQEVRLYLDAVNTSSVTLPQSPSTIEDVNNWLGRSQFAPDTQLNLSSDQIGLAVTAPK